MEENIGTHANTINNTFPKGQQIMRNDRNHRNTT